MGHDASCTNDGAIADGYSGKDRNVGADPDMAANGNGMGKFQSLIPQTCIQRMPGCRKTTIWPNKNKIPEGHRRTIQNDAVVVGIKIVAYEDILPIITPERRGDDDAIAHFPQELFQKSALLAVGRGAALVILEAQIFAYSPFFQQRRIMIGVIQKPCLGFFPFCHRKSFLSLFLVSHLLAAVYPKRCIKASHGKENALTAQDPGQAE